MSSGATLRIPQAEGASFPDMSARRSLATTSSLPPRRPFVRAVLRILGSAAGLAALAVIGLAGVGVYFLTLRFDYPVTGLVLRATADLPARDPQGVRHADYVYGERLGEMRSRRPGSGLGSAERRGDFLPAFFELRDGPGKVVARAVTAE